MRQIPDIWAESLFPGLFESTVLGVYLMIMFIWARQVQIRKEAENPAYRFYTLGLFAKVVGAVALGLVYTLYYEGGDTTGYFVSSKALVNLLFLHPGDYISVMTGPVTHELWSFFSHQTGFPLYIHDPGSFNVVKITSIFTLLGFGDFFTTSILFAWFFYTGYWKLYLLLVRLYPSYYKAFAFSVLFFPSVVFWGSGILKDTITLSMTGWFIYSFYHVFIIKHKVMINVLALIFSALMVITIKAYIFVALLPGVCIWLGWSYLKRFENPLAKVFASPLVLAVFIAMGLGLLELLQPLLGEFGTIDGIIQKAIITYEDHTREYLYGYNYYYLGTFDGTLLNFLSKAPLAIVAGLFRPFLWEAASPFMVLAALENTATLVMMVVIIWQTGVFKAIKITFDEPMAMFSLIFAIVFAFAVGVSTGNFGALVRLKIPLLPFLWVGLFILYYRSREIKNEEVIAEKQYTPVNVAAKRSA